MEKTLLSASLIFPITDTHVALGLKKQKIGAGLLNGVGGGIEPGEDALACAVREAQEEWGVVFDPGTLTKAAVVDFHNRKSDGELFTCRIHVFLGGAWEGEARESDEMGAPEWFPKNNVPFERMMLADRDWFPHVLEGAHIYAQAWYGPKQQTLEKTTLIQRVTPADIVNL